MKKKTLAISAIVLLLLAGLLYAANTVYLPYYIEKPGTPEPTLTYLHPSVTDDTAGAQTGTFYLTAVAFEQATPLGLLSQFLPFHQGVSESELLGDVHDFDTYDAQQRLYMYDSVVQAQIVALDEAKEDYRLYYYGVNVVDIAPQSGLAQVLKVGDTITHFNGHAFENTFELYELLTEGAVNEPFELTVYRDDEYVTVSAALTPFDAMYASGVGIQAVDSLEVDHTLKVELDTENVGGPSAGLMFALTLYDRLTSGDLTKGHQIAGTGTINYEGLVGPIGGIEKKVVGAYQAGIKIFLAPDFEITEEMSPYYPNAKNDYQVAKEFVEKERYDMTVVPVRTFTDAISYLNSLQPK